MAFSHMSDVRIERMVERVFRHFPIMSCSCEKRYQALSAFPYCKKQKVGGAGNEASITVFVEGQFSVCFSLPILCWQWQ